MAIRELRVTNYRAFEDSGVVTTPGMLALVGQNDVGKSAILHALQLFFDPPAKGLSLDEVHRRASDRLVGVEVAFDPTRLSSQTLRLDAKNEVDLKTENLLDCSGLLRLKLEIGAQQKASLSILIEDVDDADLFGLALTAKEADLLALLEKRGLDAKRSGRETNAAKREALRQHSIEAGSGLKQEWIALADREKPVREILPSWAFFTDDARYGVGETPVQSQFKGIVDKALRETPDARGVIDAANTTLQDEFDKVYEHLARMTPAVKGVDAKANVDWKKAISSIDVAWLDAFDVRVPYTLRGAGIRRLFMVAYFQYEAAEGLHDPKGPKYVFAVEEPEVHLHPAAQRLLMDALAELGEAGHAVVFTTHSPVFASMVPADALALVSRSGVAAELKQPPAVNLAECARELGVQASDRLIGVNKVVLVEGKSDETFFAETAAILHTAGHTQLDPADVVFLQCGGVGNLEYVATTERFKEVGLPWAVIADSDRKASADPLDAKRAALQANPPASCACVHILERSSIENYYDSSSIAVITGESIDVPEYGRPTYSASGLPVPDKTLKDQGVVSSICHHMGVTGLLKCSSPLESIDPTESELVQLFNDLANCLGS